MACDNIQSCTSLLGYPSGTSGFIGGTVKDGVQTTLGKSDSKNYNLCLHRYGEINSNITGVIYEIGTGTVLCYTIENGNKVNNGGGVKIGTHTIVPGGNDWVKESGYHEGCSSYTVSLSKGKGGFGKSTGSANTMLAISGTGCLFHPGKDNSWSEGCILIGDKADTSGKRSFDASEYFADKIATSITAAVAAHRNFYIKVVAQILAGKTVNIEVVKNYSKTLSIVNESSISNGDKGGLVSLKESLVNAGFKEGTDFEMVIPYATTQNHWKKVLSGYKANQKDSYCTKGCASKLVKAIKYMNHKYPSQYKLAIMDCFRPPTAAIEMYNICKNQHKDFDGNYVANINEKTGTPNSGHCKGGTIDLTLKYRSNGNYVNMNAGNGNSPGGFDEFSEKAHYKSENPNQALLNDIMVKGGGFSPYKNEWWHFGSTGMASNVNVTYN